jgi:hypothetical protein
MTTTTDMTTATERITELRGALALDAAVTAANGLAYLAAAGPIGDLLGVPSGALRAAGAFLLAFAVIVAATARRDEPSRMVVGAVIATNALWTIGSVVALLAGWGTPDAAGTVWIALQAVVVGGFAELQLVGLRRRARTR